MSDSEKKLRLIALCVIVIVGFVTTEVLLGATILYGHIDAALKFILVLGGIGLFIFLLCGLSNTSKDEEAESDALRSALEDLISVAAEVRPINTEKFMEYFHEQIHDAMRALGVNPDDGTLLYMFSVAQHAVLNGTCRKLLSQTAVGSKETKGSLLTRFARQLKAFLGK